MMQEPAGLVNGQMNEGMVNVLKDLVTKQTTQYLEHEEDRVDDMIKKLDKKGGKKRQLKDNKVEKIRSRKGKTPEVHIIHKHLHPCYRWQ